MALLLLPVVGAAQSVGIGTATPAASAALEIRSSSQGLLLPRLTAAQRVGIGSPAAGLLVYQTDGAAGLYYFDGSTWQRLAPEAAAPGGASPGTVTTLAGSVGNMGSTDGTGSAARFGQIRSLAADANGILYVADASNNVIRKVSPLTGAVTTLAGLAGSPGSADGTGVAARFSIPAGVAVDASFNVYVADQNNSTIRKITPAGTVTTLAGMAGASGSADGTGTAARFNLPASVAVDNTGMIYVADAGNQTIRKITPAGVVTTLAGLAGASGSADGIGSAARFQNPIGLTVDANGVVYVADLSNRTIRKVTATGMVSTLAGTVGVAGSADGTGSTAQFGAPTAVTAYGAGIVYVADGQNNTIRKVSPAGAVSTIAGTTGVAGSADGIATAAQFWGPMAITVDTNGTLYVGDTQNFTIRVVR